MPGVTKEQIQAAREADLFTYLQFHEPGVLKRDGPNFRHKEHDSLVYVTGKRYWYWNSRGRSINALDYLIQIRGYGLVDAVHALVGGEIRHTPAYRSTAEIQVSKEPEKKAFSLPWARRCATAAVSYLQKRGISSEVIRQCLQAGIFYEARYHGEPVCVFVGKDDSGKAKFACMRSIGGNLKKDVYELIQMILEKNNMHEFDTFNIFKWIFKTFVATYLLTNCFTIVMAVFDVAQNVVSQSAGVINGNLDVQAALSDLKTQLEAMGMWELIGLWLETNIINLCMWVLSIVIFVIVYGRMIEIYLTVSLAPIPFSTMANREWGQMGTGYLRSLFALGFQGFLILICVAIYAVLVQSIPSSGDVHGAIWGTAGYTVLLAFALFKTGSLSKSIFNAR